MSHFDLNPNSIPRFFYDHEGTGTFDLKNRKRLQVKKYHGTVLIDIREYYPQTNESDMRPTKKGVALTLESWGLLKLGMQAIDNQIYGLN